MKIIEKQEVEINGQLVIESLVANTRDVRELALQQGYTENDLEELTELTILFDLPFSF